MDCQSVCQYGREGKGFGMRSRGISLGMWEEAAREATGAPVLQIWACPVEQATWEAAEKLLCGGGTAHRPGVVSICVGMESEWLLYRTIQHSYVGWTLTS